MKLYFTNYRYVVIIFQYGFLLVCIFYLLFEETSFWYFCISCVFFSFMIFEFDIILQNYNIYRIIFYVSAIWASVILFWLYSIFAVFVKGQNYFYLEYL